MKLTVILEDDEGHSRTIVAENAERAAMQFDDDPDQYRIDLNPMPIIVTDHVKLTITATLYRNDAGILVTEQRFPPPHALKPPEYRRDLAVVYDRAYRQALPFGAWLRPQEDDSPELRDAIARLVART